jgi:hypothetical protein
MKNILKNNNGKQGYAIRKNDREFVISLSAEYNIPYKILGLNLSFLREVTDQTLYGDPSEGFQGILPEYVFEECPFKITIFENSCDVTNNSINSINLFRECNQKIFSYDAYIESITIKSNKGTVTLKHSDPYFHKLTTPIYLIKDEHLLASEKKDKELISSAVEACLKDTILFLMSLKSLNKFQIYVIVGRILVYFNLFRGKALLTEPEYLANPKEAQDYKHYLYDIVKSRLKKIFKDLQ